MWFHLCGLRFPASMRKSELLLGQYPNCFRTCTRDLMSASNPILRLSLFIFFRFCRVSFLSSLGTRDCRLDWIFYSSRWRCRIISGVFTSRSENRPWRIIGFSLPFAPSYLFFNPFYLHFFDISYVFHYSTADRNNTKYIQSSSKHLIASLANLKAYIS